MNNRRAFGFTLVELLVTCVLIGLIIPAAMKGVSIATLVASNASHRAQAISLAETKLAEIMLEKDWQSSNLEGNFEHPWEKFSWQMVVFDRSETDLKEIELTVSWQSRGHQRNIALSTLVFTGDE